MQYWKYVGTGEYLKRHLNLIIKHCVSDDGSGRKYPQFYGTTEASDVLISKLR